MPEKNAIYIYIHNYPLDEQQKNNVLADQNVVIISFPSSKAMHNQRAQHHTHVWVYCMGD